MRNIITLFQFMISLVMICNTLIIMHQLRYMQKKDHGFDKNNVVCLSLPYKEDVSKMKLLKDKILDYQGIESVCLSSSPIGIRSSKAVFSVETNQEMEKRGIDYLEVDQDFINTFRMRLTSGRDFSVDYPSDTANSVIINESLAVRMGWDEPLGKRVKIGGQLALDAQVIGVIQDYHQAGMYNEIESLLLVYRQAAKLLYVKIGSVYRSETLRNIQRSWESVFPNKAFNYQFVEDSLSDQFIADRIRGIVYSIFSLLSLFIAFLGILGLISYVLAKRSVEINVRRNFGASKYRLLLLLCKEFIWLILLSACISTPIAYYFSNAWLENYPFRALIGPQVYTWPVLVILMLTILMTWIELQRNWKMITTPR